MTEFSLAAELRLHATQFISELAKVKSESKSAEGEVKSGLSALSSAAAKHFESMATHSGAFGKALGSLGTMLPGAFGPVAAGVGALGSAIASVVGASIHHFEALAMSVKAFQRVSGASAADSSRMVAVANTLGVSTEALGRAFFHMNHELADSPGKFQSLGVQIVKNKQGAVDSLGTFLALAQRIHNTTDATQQSAIAFQAFGRQGLALLPILQRDSGELKQIMDLAAKRGEIISQNDINAAEKYEVTQREMRAELGAVFTAIGRQVVPVVTDFTKGLLGLANKVTDITKHFHGLGTVVKAAFSATLIGAIAAIGHHMHSAAEDTADLTAKMQEAQAAIDETKRASSELQGTMVSYLQAQRAVAAGERSIGDAQQTLADRRRSLNDLLRKGAVDTAAVTSAQHALERSTLGVQRATEAQAKAQRTLDELLHKDIPKDRAEAQRALEHAQLGVAEATQRQTEAQAALMDAYQKGDFTQISAAQLGVQEAQLGVKDAADQLTQSQQNLADLQDGAPALNERISDAQNAVTDATSALHDATDAQTDAQTSLTKAQQGNLDFAAQVIKAKHDVASAEQSVTDAQFDQATKLLALNSAWDAQATALVNDADAIDRVNASLTAVGLAPVLTAPTMPPSGNVLDKVRAPGGGLRTMAAGGIIPGPMGTPVPIIAHSGEEIVSAAHASGGRSGPSHVVVPVVLDGREIARVVAPLVRGEQLRGKRRWIDAGLS